MTTSTDYLKQYLKEFASIIAINLIDSFVLDSVILIEDFTKKSDIDLPNSSEFLKLKPENIK